MNIDELMGTTPARPVTRAQIAGTVAVCMAVAETVREAGSTPEGPLYAVLMTKGISHQDFEAIVNTLTSTGLIERTAGHVLKWTGPTVAR